MTQKSSNIQGVKDEGSTVDISVATESRNRTRAHQTLETIRRMSHANMKTEIQYTSKQVFWVLLFSGTVGFIVGIIFVNWQVGIESGQVMANIVQYPHGNPNYLYLTKAWTLPGQIIAVFLYLGVSEKLLSIIISGITGMVSFQALAVIVFSFSRNIFYSVVFPFLFFNLEKMTGLGANYPIMLWGSPATWGSLSLSYIILAVGLPGVRLFRIGALLIGMAPAIHIVQGSFLCLFIGIVVLLGDKTVKNLAYQGRWYFLAGLLICIGSFTIHFLFVDRVPHIAHDIMLGYIEGFKFWEPHRFPIGLLNKSLLLNALVVAVSLHLLRNKKINDTCLMFMTRTITVYAVSGLFFALYSNFPSYMPYWLYIMMPARILNVNSVCSIAILTGFMVYKKENIFVHLIHIFLIYAVYINLVRYPENLIYINVLVLSFCLLILTLLSVYAPEKLSDMQKRLSKSRLYLNFPAITIFISLSIFIYSYNSRILTFYRHENRVIRAASRGEGILLTSSNIYLIQAQTRRPILLFAGSLDFVNYVPATGPRMAHILKTVYGIDFFHPPASVKGQGGLVRDIDKSLWERRNIDDWTRVKKEFNVTDILTWGNYNLQLPLVARDRYYALYHIP